MTQDEINRLYRARLDALANGYATTYHQSPVRRLVECVKCGMHCDSSMVEDDICDDCFEIDKMTGNVST